jgi:DNA-binding MarR family transcriptional regulator
MARPATIAEQDTTDPLGMHRRYWFESLDLDVLALMLALHRARDHSLARATRVWRRHGMTAAEFDVLATLRRSPPPRELTPSDIQDALAITSGGLTKVMNRLESRKLVSRSKDERDQRIKPVKLTTKGKRQVEETMAELTSASGTAVRASLTTDEIASLTDLLRRLVETHGTENGSDGHPAATVSCP